MNAAEQLVKSLGQLGASHLFALSGNQIMTVFDACLDSTLQVIHVRHEASAVHMADGWGRLTGQPGVALVTAGPGFANCLSALYVARVAESPLLFLSGASPLSRAGLGPFQEMAQLDMAVSVCKASFQLEDPDEIAVLVAEAYQVAADGRPGPVHLNLPVDKLEAAAAPVDRRIPNGDAETAEAPQVSAQLEQSKRPLILLGPAAARWETGGRLQRAAAQLGIPAIRMESPRGVRDPRGGALARVVGEADFALLIGKRLDFTLHPGGKPAFAADCVLEIWDPEEEVLKQAERVLTQLASPNGHSLHLQQVSFEVAADLLAKLSCSSNWSDWSLRVKQLLAQRVTWQAEDFPEPGLHPAELCQIVVETFDAPETIFVADGGEFGQWAQASIGERRCVINGPSGSIGSAIPLALSGKAACPGARVVAFLGDGTMGFQPFEIDTAVRYNLPILLVVGNDARWNAEYQIQCRRFGETRAQGCELLPTRMDLVAEALGGQGAHAETRSELQQALGQAAASTRAFCLDVRIHPVAAPTV